MNDRAIQRARRNAGFRSAADFADAIGVDRVWYSKLERCAEPDYDIPAKWFVEVADALHINITTVMGR